MSGHRPEAIMTTGQCSRCKGTFSFAQRTNKHHYCEPCKDIRARLTNARYARKKTKKTRAALLARLVAHPSFPDRWLWLDPETTHIYRKDGPRKYVRVGTNGELHARKTKQETKTSPDPRPAVRASR